MENLLQKPEEQISGSDQDTKLTQRADLLREIGARLDGPDTNQAELDIYCELLHELYFDAAMAGLYRICDRALAYRDRINPDYTTNRKGVVEQLDQLEREVDPFAFEEIAVDVINEAMQDYYPENE